MHFFALLAIAAMSSSVRAFTTNSLEDKCKVDLLIVLDTSDSIGRPEFDERVKPFLKSLIANSTLNVGPNGTHIGIIIFSNEENTRVLLKFGEKTSQGDLKRYIEEKMKWDDVKGDQTRTGSALEEANKTFSKISPNNARPNINDVLMLITDGHPNGRFNELEIAYKNAEALRDKKVVFVGIAVGPNRRNFTHIIEKIVGSKNNTFDEEFGKLHTILDKVVDTSCNSSATTACSCPSTSTPQVAYLKPGDSTVGVTWTVPKPSCPATETSVTPNVSPGTLFQRGKHTVDYLYRTDAGFDFTCNVNFEVKACSCPCTILSLLKVAYLKPGESTVGVTWTVPKPTCPATETSVTPNVSLGTPFQRGEHAVNYLYRTDAGFDLTCSVHIVVKVCECLDMSQHSYYVHPDNPWRSVTWTVPKPTCTGEPITRTDIIPNVSPGHSFAIGRHSVRYVYKMQIGFTLTCGVDIEIKVVPCQGRDYDPAIKICCCGKVWTKKRGWKCCGWKYHNAAFGKCCPLFYNLVAPSASCPGDDIVS